MYKTTFLGAGPGGSGPIVCALQQNKLDQLLDTNIAILDRADTMARGRIGDYAINSDTLSDTFLECLKHDGSVRIAEIGATPPANKIRAYAGGPSPLTLAAEFMTELGGALQTQIKDHPRSAFFASTLGQSIHMQPDGSYRTRAVHRNGVDTPVDFHSRNLVFAMGGAQSWERIKRERILGGIQLAEFEDKTLISHTVLSRGGIEQIQARLAGVRNPRVVIVGGSHSAVSSANVLLASGLPFDDGAIAIAHRNRLKLFYPSAAAAHAEGYTDFDDNDICPLTKRLYRLAGFRFDSRELLMRIWGMAGRARETRVRLYDLEANAQLHVLREQLASADLIVAALGYRPNTVPVYDVDGARIPLRAELPGTGALVDRRCRVIKADGTPLPNAYGIGLASGFVPDGDLGGEPSFQGQTNGLWLYQNGVGQIVLDSIL